MEGIIYLKALIMGVVEGITEFLPISSTGHLILTGALINFTGETARVFEIAIQTGAMFAVIWQFRIKLLATFIGIFNDAVAQKFVLNLIAAFLPAVISGLALGGMIKDHLFSAIPVSLAFIIGGILIIFIEKRARQRCESRVKSVDDMTLKDAFLVGMLQCLALIPGTSRSGATIIGGMALGLSRKCATEFSFYLGIPTLMGAGAYSVWKAHDSMHSSDTLLFLIGLIAAFISALFCIRWLIRFVSTHDFVPFAWYRILFGIVVLLTAWSGLVTWSS